MKKRLPSAQKDRVGAKETNARKRKGQAESPALSFAAALFIPFGPVSYTHLGQVHAFQLPADAHYTFRETLSPNGHALNLNTFSFDILPDGTVSGVTEFTDDVSRIRVLKIDAVTKQPLSGVSFGLYNQAGEQLQIQKTNSKGVAEFIIEQGTWQIIEVSALDGYAPVSYTHLDVYKRQASCAHAPSVFAASYKALASSKAVFPIINGLRSSAILTYRCCSDAQICLPLNISVNGPAK